MPAEKSALTEALAKVQAELPKVTKGETATVETKQGGTYKYTYADLAAVSEAILPRLGEHGLAWVTRPTVVEGRFVLAYELRHVSGEKIEGEFPLSGSTPQQQGAAITYARRYCLCSVTGVAPESDDDDAKAASHRQYDRPPAFHEGTSRQASSAGPDPTPTDDQVDTHFDFREQIKVASAVGLAALVPEIKAAAEEGRITDRQNRDLAEWWQKRKAELDAKAAAGPAPEGQSDG